MERSAKTQVKASEQQSKCSLDDTLLFLVTAMAEIGLHSLRTSYSFSKSILHREYLFKRELLGTVDQVFLFSIAIGMLLNAFCLFRSPKKWLVLSLVSTGLISSLFPLFVGQLGKKSYTAVLVLQLICGFTQSFVWPNLLCIFDRHRQSKDTALLGLWISSSNIGNICGFLLCHVLVIWLLGDWKLPIQISAAITCLSGLGCLLLPDAEQEVSESEEGEESVWKLLLRPVPFLSMIIMAILKSIVYGLLLWLPLLFTQAGMSQYSSLIPISFDLSSVFGAVLLGDAIQYFQVKFKVLAAVKLLLVVLFALLYFLTPSVTLYFVLISLVGMCLGGLNSTLVGYVTLQVTKSKKNKNTVKFFSAISMFMATTAGALTQLLVGFVAGGGMKSIFVLFLGYSCLAFITGLAVLYHELKRVRKNERQFSKAVQN